MHVCVARICVHACENLRMGMRVVCAARVSVLYSLHPCAPHSRPRLVPPTFPRCARAGLLRQRGDVCSEAHSPLLRLWALTSRSVRKASRERARGAAGPESLRPRGQAGPRGEPESGARDLGVNKSVGSSLRLPLPPLSLPRVPCLPSCLAA